MGSGILGARRLMDEFRIDTVPGRRLYRDDGEAPPEACA